MKLIRNPLLFLLSCLILATVALAQQRVELRIIVLGGRAKAEQILEQLKAGADFKQLAQEHSLGPSAKAGGDVGTISIDKLRPRFRAAVAELEPGSFTDVIKIGELFSILQLVPEGGRVKAEKKLPATSGISPKPSQRSDWEELNKKVKQLYRQGKYQQGLRLARDALRLAEGTNGPNHPNVATSLNDLALLFYAQGKYAQAEPLFKRSLAIWEKDLGPDHPYLATVLENMAELYKRMGRQADAQKAKARARSIRSKKR